MLSPKTRYPKLLLTATNDVLVRDLLLLARTKALRRLTPGGNRGTTRGVVLALATAVRVVDRVHDGTADGRAHVQVTLTAGLADDDVGVIGVADLTDGGGR